MTSVYMGDRIKRFDGLIHQVTATKWGCGLVKYSYYIACSHKETDVIFEGTTNPTREPVTCMACISAVLR